MKLKYFIIMLVSLFCFSSCTKDDLDGYKDIEMSYFDGTWYSDECTIEFTATDETFVMITDEHEITCYFGLSEGKDALSLTYVEDEEGEELMSDEDYDNGWFCPFVVIDDNKVKINNLPLFRNTTIELHK